MASICLFKIRYEIERILSGYDTGEKTSRE